MRNSWWLGIVAALVVMPQAHAQQTRALVIEGQADATQLEQLQNEFGVDEIERKGHDVWLVTPQQRDEVRARLEGLGMNVGGVDQPFSTLLAPVDADLGQAQQAQLAELARAPDARVTVLRSQPPQLAAMAFSRGLGALATNESAGAALARGSFAIDLGGRSFVLTREDDGGAVWTGSSGDALANLIYADGLIRGFVQTQATSIEIVPLGGDLYAAVEAPTMVEADDTSAEPSAAPAGDHDPRAPCTPQNPCIINVGVVYSAAALQGTGSVLSPQALAEDEMRNLNETMHQAWLNHERLNRRIRFRLAVPVRQEPHQRSSVSEQRESLADPASGGFEAGIRDWRQDHDIDVVVMVGRWDDGDLCGEASIRYQRARSAFAVVNRLQGCSEKNTFTHEVGHLLGMDHDRRSILIGDCHVEEGTPPSWCNGFPAAPADSEPREPFLQDVDDHCATHACPLPEEPILGFCSRADGQYRHVTIMGYRHNCGNVWRQLWWSNPNQKAQGTSIAIGDNRAYQVSQLPITAPYVAAHSDYLGN